MGDVKNPGVIRNTSSGGSVSVTPTSGYGVVNLEVNLSGGGITGRLPFAKLAQGSALSVLGVAGNATSDNASIVAASDAQVLRRSGTSVGFGAINLASTNAVSGILAEANGGYSVYDEPSVASLVNQTINAGSTYTWSIPLNASNFTHGIIQVMNVDGGTFPYNTGVTAIIATATTDCYGWSANVNYVYASYINTVLFRSVSVHTNLTGSSCFGNGATGDVRINNIRINGSNIDIVFGNTVAVSRTINARAQYRLGKGTVQSA